MKFDVVVENQLVGMIPHELVHLSITDRSRQCVHCDSVWVDTHTFLNVVTTKLDIPELSTLILDAERRGIPFVFLGDKNGRCDHRMIRCPDELPCSMCDTNKQEVYRVFGNSVSNDIRKHIGEMCGSVYSERFVCRDCSILAASVEEK